MQNGKLAIANNLTNGFGFGSTEFFKNQSIPVPQTEMQTEIADHIRQLREQAKQLQQEADKELEKVSRNVERVILRNDYSGSI